MQRPSSRRGASADELVLLARLKRSLLGSVCVTACLALPMTADAHPLDHLQTQADVGLHKIPNHGTSHVLVIPLWTGEAEYPAARLQDLRDYYTEEALPGTFRRYWLDVSGGRYDPIPTLVEPVLYPDSCPLPGKTVEDCDITFADTDLIGSGGVGVALEDILARVRDEQGIDLSQFDVNGADESPDGYFDGLVISTNIASGVAPPLAGINNAATVNTLPDGLGGEITASLVAMIPPNEHEYAHLFGFIDLYNGPTVNGLMGETRNNTLSAYSRQQIGWGEVTEITESMEIELLPVLEGQQILRVDTEAGYLLIENRSGALHDLYETAHPGIYVYSIDEEALPSGPLGWLDAANLDLYYPNSEAPYLNVALPLNCRRTEAGANGCVVDDGGSPRELVHESGALAEMSLSVIEVRADGTRVLSFESSATPPTPIPMGGGCAVSAGSTNPWALAPLVMSVLLLRRRRRA